MKLITLSKHLLQGVRITERSSGRSNQPSILQSTLLKTENGRLSLYTTNLEMASIYRIGVKIDTEGEVAVSTKILGELLNNIQEDKINLQTKDNYLLIESGTYKSRINTLNAKEFPIIPRLDKTLVATVEIKAFRNTLFSVFESASISESRPELSGIHFSLREKQLVCAATDSFRLAEHKTNAIIERNEAFIVPKQAITELIRLCSEIGEGDVKIILNEGQVKFATENGEIISKIIEGKYPDYQKIIPQEFLSLSKYNTGKLIQTIKAVAIFSSNLNEISMIRKETMTDFFSQNSEKGEIRASIEHEGKGENFELNLNCQYLLDGLKNINNTKTLINYVGEKAPLVLGPDTKETSYTYLVMPLKK